MKRILLPILILSILGTSATVGVAQSATDVLNIALSGDANTEQSAKLELIRILNERLNKLTVAQLNSRIIVSAGVKNYYKVDEIFKMHNQMWLFQAQLNKEARALGNDNAGFLQSGFTQSYQVQITEAMNTAAAVKKQTQVLIADGRPIVLPPMPTFSISPAKSSADAVGSFADQMKGIMASFGISSEADMNNLSPERRAAFDSAVNTAKSEFEKQFKAAGDATTKQSLTLLGNVVGTMFGVPGAGSLIAGLASGGGVSAALSGLVGSIVDKFQIPDEYYDSGTLKLTDSERLKMIDELHTRMSETFQKGMALRANMNSEVKKRYNDISQPRNEQILYGPKK